MADGQPEQHQPESEGRCSMLPATPSKFQIREMLLDAVLKDLQGPAGGPTEEIDEQRVSDRYLVGMLAPQKQRIAPEELDALEVGGRDTVEEGQVDVPPIGPDTLLPSSFGMTFCACGDASALRVTARWGQYKREPSATLLTDKTGAHKLVWKRYPVEGVLVIPLKEGDLRPVPAASDHPDVVIQGRVRKQEGHWFVSLFLVNGQEEPKRVRDATYLFQPELIVEDADGNAPFCRKPLVESRSKLDPVTRAEEEAMGMLYRRQVEFAVGHGISVHWDLAPGVDDRAVRLCTRTVPRYEAPLQTPPTAKDNPALAAVELDMKELSLLPREELSARLLPLTESYAGWIERERTKVTAIATGLDDHREAASQALSHCEDALERIRAGIDLLSRDAQAAAAFQFANRAMWQQRVRSIYAQKVRRGEQPALGETDIPRNRAWYPFQLAFILLNLPSVTDIHHPDRSHESSAIADLLWFPTGGGKTEAYLGLTAYTLAIRRLQSVVEGRPGEDGVAVLMRYTLRLLTLQQFQRAAALVCACEMIRRDDPARWGNTPFRVGLWVGMRTTPNTTDDSEKSIQQQHGEYQQGSSISGTGSPVQLTGCPWCGQAIKPGEHVKVELGLSKRNRTFIYCGDDLGSCPFTEAGSPYEGIPVLVVDEEIYRCLPSLLISTVDKFAQMPWKGQVGMLFGQVTGHCPRHGFQSADLPDSPSHNANRSLDLPAVRSVERGPLRPPDLVIQDELHLISGPLGTLVGLYETAVDELCSWEVDGRRVRPKVIASTATIRRAETQVHALFLRKVRVFPPYGTEIGDNFFSLQREPGEEYPGRLYLGICAPGKRLKAAMIRVYVALMSAAQQLYEKYDTAADPWMTLVGYFNSMRELGGMRRVVDDDVRSRLRQMDSRGLAKRAAPFVRELTSRIGSSDIPKVLDQLEAPFSLEGEAQRKEMDRKERSENPPPIDVLLATNMISVGVDVQRLGLMVVSGQPKTTSDYIQATSRVGRRVPGLVCTVFNWAKPRDLSHYERFEHYHATFYQRVEPLSVTPFAARALDRGLSGVLVALVRLADDTMNGNNQARAIDPAAEGVRRAIRAITDRARLVTGQEQAGAEVLDMIMRRLKDWDAEARRPAQKLGYRTVKDSETVGLLRSPGLGFWEPFTCLNSLRDVEPAVGLILTDGRGLDNLGGD